MPWCQVLQVSFHEAVDPGGVKRSGQHEVSSARDLMNDSVRERLKSCVSASFFQRPNSTN